MTLLVTLFEAQGDERGAKLQIKEQHLCVRGCLSRLPAGRPITSSSSHVAISKRDKCQAVSPSRRFTHARFSSSPSLRASDLARLKAKRLLNSPEDVHGAGSRSLTSP